MASAIDDEELSASLPALVREGHPSIERESESESDILSSQSTTPAGMTMTPPSLPRAGRGGEAPFKRSASANRDMQRLDQYKTIKILGEGSFGKVKLALHQPSGRQVALKIIPRRKLLSRDMVGRVEREIQYLQLLRHPHIIKL